MCLPESAFWLPGAVAAIGVGIATTMIMELSVPMPIKSIMGRVGGFAVGVAVLSLLDRRMRALIKRPREIMNIA
jgi:hypothetical protein